MHLYSTSSWNSVCFTAFGTGSLSLQSTYTCTKKILWATPKSSWLRPDWFKRAENIPTCLILISLFREMVPTLCVIFKCLIPVLHQFAVTAGSVKCDLCRDQWEFCYWIQCSHDSPGIAGVYLLLISLSAAAFTHFSYILNMDVYRYLPFVDIICFRQKTSVQTLSVTI